MVDLASLAGNRFVFCARFRVKTARSSISFPERSCFASFSFYKHFLYRSENRVEVARRAMCCCCCIYCVAQEGRVPGRNYYGHQAFGSYRLGPRVGNAGCIASSTFCRRV
jgi:hypothetical protein